MKAYFHQQLQFSPGEDSQGQESYIVTVLAGGGDGIAKDGTGTEAGFTSNLNHITATPDGSVYVADGSNLRRISPGGEVSTLLGSFIMMPDGSFFQPENSLPADAYGIAINKQGHLFLTLADHTIGLVRGAGPIETVAGTSWSTGTTDGGATVAGFYDLKGITIDHAGNIFVIDAYNGRIRKLSADLHTVSTVAGSNRGDFATGTGSAAVFPMETFGLTADSKGNLYAGVNMPRGSCVAKITAAGEVTVFAGDTEQPGEADGNGTDARFNTINALCCDKDDTIWVACNKKIRKISSGGKVSTISCQNSEGKDVWFSYLNGICAGPSGDIYVSDMGTCCILKISKP